jgi:hypothetical protein
MNQEYPILVFNPQEIIVEDVVVALSEQVSVISDKLKLIKVTDTATQVQKAVTAGAQKVPPSQAEIPGVGRLECGWAIVYIFGSH